MNRQELEEAISSLKGMLEGPELPEHEYQKWLENHSVVFECLGYSNFIPHPQLTQDGALLFEPDFLVQRADTMIWDIFEIKRPSEPVLKPQRRRQDLYATIHTYIKQCIEYSEYFDDKANREEFSSNYGFGVFKSPYKTLVVGREANLERDVLHNILHNLGNPVSLLTYDNLLGKLEFYRLRQFQCYEKLNGFSIHLYIRSEKLDVHNYIIDIGTQEANNRVTLYIDDKDYLCYKVIDVNGHSQVTRLPIGPQSIIYNEWCYLLFECGIADDYTYFAVDVDGRNCFHTQLPGLSIEPLEPHCVFGSDMTGREDSKFSIKTTLITTRTLTFEERNGVRREIIESGTPEDYHLEYSNHQFAFTKYHPRWVPQQEANESDGHFGDLMQPEAKHKPCFVSNTQRWPLP